MTTVAIHQPQYLPYLGFFHKIAHCDVFVALDNVQFQKNGLQNRNKIKNSAGWQWLTVPVFHKSDQKICSVQINNDISWSRKHAQAIRTSYGKAPYFQWCWDTLGHVYDEAWPLLSNLNMRLTTLVCEGLGIRTPILNASEMNMVGNATDLLISICQELRADAYFSGPGGERYMELDKFEAAGIKIIWQKFEFPTYPQVFSEGGFEPNLSIIDTLVNCGPVTKGLIGL